MRYRYFTCDVFTKVRFGGNQLAVFPDATGLTADQMQQIAREFNYSETTFVLPAGDRYSRKVRIFTPSVEVPFAGHPNIGTAFVLAMSGDFGEIGDRVTVTFEEFAGAVPVTLQRDEDGALWCELAAPCALSLGATVDPAIAAAVLSLTAQDIEISTHMPIVASVGLPFLIIEVGSVDALRRARINITSLEELRNTGVVPDVHVYTHSRDEFDIRARMFSPFDGVPEDPATGSANCALAALLEHSGVSGSAGGSWSICQGVEVGRPSVLQARANREGAAINAWVGGYCVLVADGLIKVD